MPAARLRVLGSEAILLLVAILWGVAFVAQKRAEDAGIGVMAVTGMRFLMGAGVLLPLVLWRRSRGHRTEPTAQRQLWGGGIAAGGAMFVASALQQAGMQWTMPGVAGFITGLYVIFVPVIARLLGARIGWPVWTGATLAAAGLYLLSVHGRLQISPGDVLILGCAVAWAIHVLIVGWAAPRVDPIELSVIQFTVTGVFGAIGTVMLGGVPFGEFMLAPFDVLYLGLIAVGVAFTLQVVGQRHAPAAHAVIILSLESVFGAIAGALMLGERFDGYGIVGAGLMLAGIIISQVIRPPTDAALSDAVASPKSSRAAD